MSRRWHDRDGRGRRAEQWHTSRDLVDPRRLVSVGSCALRRARVLRRMGVDVGRDRRRRRVRSSRRRLEGVRRCSPFVGRCCPCGIARAPATRPRRLPNWLSASRAAALGNNDAALSRWLFRSERAHRARPAPHAARRVRRCPSWRVFCAEELECIERGRPPDSSVFAATGAARDSARARQLRSWRAHRARAGPRRDVFLAGATRTEVGEHIVRGRSL